MKNQKLSSFFIIAAGALWGVMGVFVRMLDVYGFSPLQITALRLLVGEVLILVFVSVTGIRKLKIQLRDLPVFIAMGLLSILMMSWLYFSAILETSLSVAAILLYTAPVWVLFASVLFYREKLTVKKLIALVTAFIGCVLVCGVTSTDGVSLKGIILGLGSGLAYALYSIIGKKALEKYHPFTVTAWAFLFAAFGAVAICRPAEAFEIIINTADIKTLLLKLFGIGFITVFLSYILYTKGLKSVPAGSAAIMASVEPLVATVAGMILYSEMPGIPGYMGIALIICAIVLLNMG